VGSGEKIEVTNYERLHHIDASAYQAVVLDESSILKAFDGKTRTRLIQTFRQTPYRLCCTATPAPNDVTELTNHAEFLGIMTRPEMLATWFVHDEQAWRLKRHAQAPFAAWLASWAMFLRRPSDLGFDDDGFQLPPLWLQEIVVAGAHTTSLFPELGLRGVGDRQRVRRLSVTARVAAATAWTGAVAPPWIAWCGLNAEQDALAATVEAVSVSGAQSEAEKETRIQAFLQGTTPGLITKPRIAGFGLNLQHCARMAFVGMSDSFETFYQAVRRCWRYGQHRPVEVALIVSESERGIVQNVKRKQRDFEALVEAMVALVRDDEQEALV
jgi:hypothetical protein